MGNKKLVLIIMAIMMLTFASITISYGYWTDELNISGEGTFRYHLSVVNDIEIAEDESTEISEGAEFTEEISITQPEEEEPTEDGSSELQ